jgi:peptidoglycan/xylan/chitin deacetylase (PgdA/CDA1 family)
MLHHFHGGHHKPDNSGSLSAEQLNSVLLKIGLSRFVTPERWISGVTKGDLPETAVCLTFDDGLRSQIDVCMPVLDSHGLKAFWFVYSAPMEGQMPLLEIFRRFRYFYFDNVNEYYESFFAECAQDSLEKIQTSAFKDFYSDYSTRFPFYSDTDIKYRYLRDQVLSRDKYEKLVISIMEANHLSVETLSEGLWLSDSDIQLLNKTGHEIGLHSYDHPTNMARLSIEEQLEQYSRNYLHLTGLGVTPRTVAHPGGSYSKETLTILADMGLDCGFRSSMDASSLAPHYGTNLEMPRQDVVHFISAFQ